MPAPKALDKAGVLLFFSLLSIVAAIIGFIKGAECGPWLCSYFFLILAVILFFWGFETAR
jgi:hypothetical protein